MAVDLSFLKDENNPEILRKFTEIIAERNAFLECRIAELEKLEAEKRQQVFDLNARYSILRREYFKQGREKFSAKNEDRPRSTAEQEVLVHAKSLVPPPKPNDIEGLEQRRIRHTASIDELNELLREREPELAKDFTVDWQEMASFIESSKLLTIVERKFIEVIHERQKYKAKIINPVSGEEKEVILAARGPEKLMPGCSYGIELAVAVVADKYLMHLPLERQRRAMAAQGLKNVSVKTLWNLCWAVGEHLTPVAAKIKNDVLMNHLCVHADETPWPVQGKDSNGYLWSVSNMAGSYYRFEPSRSGKVIEEMLNDYSGSVMSDGFKGYNRLKVNSQIKLSHCWAHVRRKFFQIYELSHESGSREILKMLDDLFAIERKARDFYELENLRREESTELIKKIKLWLEEETTRCLPQSQMRKAINYTLELWSGLTLFLTDEKIPLSNNDAERALRHAVVGRKNYYGSKTIDGADLAATLFTVIESCKRVELEPRAFIEMAVRASARGEDPPSPLEYARKIRGVEAASIAN